MSSNLKRKEAIWTVTSHSRSSALPSVSGGSASLGGLRSTCGGHPKASWAFSGPVLGCGCLGTSAHPCLARVTVVTSLQLTQKTAVTLSQILR